ncbi:MAG TPA: phosphate/phosphite/phosphonate ABC transporter substrate-binding protein [Rhizobiaceae bacterium]|nr:phosphate/phosphite/phosphonate ABC transporter substrate-binding protein [Rhizobiaceae bacterium]
MPKSLKCTTAAGLAIGAIFSLNTIATAAPTSWCPEGGPVRFGVEPYEATAVLAPLYDEFGKLLAAKLGCPVKIQITTSYTTEIEAMRQGKLEAAELGPFGYELAKKEVPGLTAVAQFGSSDGKPVSYWASIVTWKGSGIKTLKDLKGKSFAFADPASTSGYLMPAYGMKSVGLDAKKDVKGVFAGTHTASFEALRNHKVQAGELNSDTLALAKLKGWWKEDDYVTLWRSKPLPLDPIVIDPKLRDPLRKHLVDALQSLRLVPPMSQEAFKVMGDANSLVPATDETYDVIGDVMREMHVSQSM